VPIIALLLSLSKWPCETFLPKGYLMKRITLTLLSGFTALTATTAFAADLGPLIAPADLIATSEQPIVLDIRGEGFETGHIEGAVSAPYSLFRGPADNPGQIPAVEQLEILFERLGLDPMRSVVIVSQGDTDTDFGAAARVYWTLKSSGFTELSVLNGGATAWVNAGFPLAIQTSQPIPTDIDVMWSNTWTADTAAVERVVAGEGGGKLIDARPAAFFEGKNAHAAAARPGTLPGAQSLPYTEFFRPGATAISNDIDVSELKTSLGIEAGDAVVSFCNTGHWAATNWFAMSELAGLENVKLYPGSMVEYSQTDGEMQNQPGLISNFINQITGDN
jgi:thiosulfate/3-mercaptopyruvate sulfurtransferase